MRALDPAAQAELDDVVARGADAVRRALAGIGVPEPVFALCLHYEPSSADLLDPPVVYIGVESDRRRALAVGDRLDTFALTWNPMEYTGGEVFLEPSLRDDDSFVAVEARVVAALRDAGNEEPARLVLNEVARQLTERPPIGPVADDFVTFVMDPGFADDLLGNLRTSAPQAVAERLRERGLLPDSVDDLTEA